MFAARWCIDRGRCILIPAKKPAQPAGPLSELLVGTSERGPISIINAPARPSDTRLALLIIACLAIATLASAPFSGVLLEGSEPLLPAYAASLFINELITFTLLAGIYAVERSRAVLILASGYLFASLTVIPWILSFPGVFAIIGLDAGLQGTAVIAALRRIGMPVFVLAYALLRDRPSTPSGLAPRGIITTLILTGGSVAVMTWLVLAGREILPPLMRDTRNVAALWQVVPVLALLLYAATLLALWRKRPTILDLWLMVVIVTLAVELVMLSYISSGVRLSLGWWVGRLCGLVSGSTILVILLSATTGLYARLAGALVEERRARVDRMVAMKALSAAIAHEVNQPLASMVTNANAALRWLRRDTPDRAEAEAALERIVVDGHRTGQLVRNIRTLIRTEEADRVRTDPNDVIREIARVRGGEARLSGVAIALDLSAVPPIAADPVHLQLVVGNLLANAIDAAGAGRAQRGAVTIASFRTPAGETALTVADNGPGIDAEVREHIFDPFVTTKPPGLGMGLMICRSIVEACGGRIEVEDNPSGGTLFRVILPAAPLGPNRSGGTP